MLTAFADTRGGRCSHGTSSWAIAVSVVRAERPFAYAKERSGHV
jgi:hypothetical protein